MPRPDTLRYRGQADGPLEGGLPKGGVSEVEVQMDVVEDAEVAPADAPPEAQPEFEEEDVPGGVFDEDELFDEELGDEDDEKLLFEPTFSPDEPLTAGVGPTTAQRLRPPDDVVNWLPVLAQAAKAPNAPEQVKALLRLITHHLRG